GRFTSVGELAEALVPMASTRMHPYLKRIWNALNGVRQSITFGDTTAKIAGGPSWTVDGTGSMLTEDTRGSESLVVQGTEGPVTAPSKAQRDALIVAEVIPKKSWLSTSLVIALAIALPAAAAVWRKSKTPSAPPPVATAPVADAGEAPVTQIEIYAPPPGRAPDASAPVATPVVTSTPVVTTIAGGGAVAPSPTPRRPPPPKPAPAPPPPAPHPHPLTYR